MYVWPLEAGFPYFQPELMSKVLQNAKSLRGTRLPLVAIGLKFA